MFPGVDLLMKRLILIWSVFIALLPSLSQAEPQTAPPGEEKKGIYAVVKDGQGEAVEGLLRFSSDELVVRSKDNQEKSIPLKYIKSITLEKTKGEIPGEELKNEATYAVRLENSQEIYTLRKKYTFSLNTNVGLVTKTIDPDKVNSFLTKDLSPTLKPDDGKPFIQDKSVVFSLEFKF